MHLTIGKIYMGPPSFYTVRVGNAQASLEADMGGFWQSLSLVQ